MNKCLYTFVHYNSNVNTSEIIKLDHNMHDVPHCTTNYAQLADYKLEFKGRNDNEYDIYLDKESLFDIFITLINDVRENDTLEYIQIENIVRPDERYCYKSHSNLSHNKLLQLINKNYKLMCHILIQQEEIDGKKTGRIILSFDFSYKLFFITFHINEEPIEAKINSDHIMELQTEVYKEFKQSVTEQQ